MISCAFATSLASPEHIAIAEDLGYRRAWLYDTPQQSPDVWMTLARAAERTERIGLGPGVLVPTLRHPMVNAAGAAALCALAPGRVAVAFGTGFTGRRAMGQGAISWRYMRDYVTAFKGLLSGQVIEWEGGRLKMLHPDGYAPDRPIEFPVYIAALGPKGRIVAEEIGDGLFVASSVPDFVGEFEHCALLLQGTVLDEGEALDAERVRAAAGPGNAVAFHATYELGGDVSELPGGSAWIEAISQTPEAERHFAIHEQHLVGLNDADTAAWNAGAWGAIPATTVTGQPAEVERRLVDLAEQGITEFAYQPSGADIPRELKSFMAVAQSIVPVA
jgi:5,10-methylenetetrahydromethanopterin reductase